MKINKESIFTSVSVPQQRGIEKERFQKVFDYFKEREKKSAEILNSPSPVVDPSL